MVWPTRGSKIVVAVVFLVAGAVRLSAQQESPLATGVGPRTLRIAYGSDTTQFGELRLPTGSGPHPVVIVIHGGCFLARLGLGHVRDLARAVTGLGTATWSIEFRRVDSPGGGWPGTWRDVADATDYLRVLASRYQLDLTRVVVLGHSSGGNLALWVSTRSRLPAGSPLSAENPLPVSTAVVLDSHLDPLYYEHKLYPSGAYHCRESLLPRLIGGRAHEVPDRLRQVSPFALLPTGVHQILLYSPPRDPNLAHMLTPDGSATYRARNYPAEARRAGDNVEVVVVPGTGHSDFVKPSSPAWSQIATVVRRVVGLQ